MSDRHLAYLFGVVFIVVLLVLAVLFPTPTATQFFVFRVVLSLAAAGIGAVLPGLISVNFHKLVRAGGALALFVIVYLVNPPALVVTADADLVERGEVALVNGDTSSAITLFSEAVEKNPANWRAYSGIGRAYYARNDYKNAETRFSKAVELSKKQAWAPLIGLSMAHEGNKDLKAALEALSDALPSMQQDAARAALFDKGRLLLLYWLQADAPKITQSHKDAESAFQEFLKNKGYPSHWAWYHLACLQATGANGVSPSEAEALRRAGVSSLYTSVAELGKYDSPKAPLQQQMMRDLLSSKPRQHKPGDPVACDAAAGLWRSLDHSSAQLPAYMTRAGT